MNIFLTSVGQLGCTFLDWGFHYLSNNDFHWVEKKGIWKKLVSDPVGSNNAHLHDRNHVSGLKKYKVIIDKFSSYPKNKDFSFYVGYSHDQTFEEYNGGVTLLDAFDYALNNNFKVIFLYCDHPRPVLLDRRDDPGGGASRDDRNCAYRTKLMQLFRSNPGLDQLIDTDSKMREFLSLSMRHLYLNDWDYFQIKNLHNHPNKMNFYAMNYRDLVMRGEDTTKDMFNFLGRPINQSRLQHWKTIHKKWKKILSPSIKFHDDLPKILEHIIEGKSLCLKAYSLDVFLEAQIQHELMKRFNQRLQVKNLDCFPDDTAELNLLLKK